MILINRLENDPWFQIAADEFVVKYLAEDVFMLWENDDCVVVGKHQNTLAEVNFSFLQAHEIPVIRRISGGGTVFQGLGNLNFSFITTIVDNDKINFKKFTDSIIFYLQSLGVPATRSGKSNLTINGLKISGNAAHIHKNRVLHHGTLLFNADLEKIAQALKVNEGAYLSKGVASVPAPITNISSFLDSGFTMETFREGLRLWISNHFEVEYDRNFSSLEMESIRKLSTEKYQSWEWNFAYSPDYNVNRSLEIEGKQYAISLHVHRGVIVRTDLDATMPMAQELKNVLIHCPHQKKPLLDALEGSELSDIFDAPNINYLVSRLL